MDARFKQVINEIRATSVERVLDKLRRLVSDLESELSALRGAEGGASKEPRAVRGGRRKLKAGPGKGVRRTKRTDAGDAPARRKKGDSGGKHSGKQGEETVQPVTKLRGRKPRTNRVDKTVFTPDENSPGGVKRERFIEDVTLPRESPVAPE